MYTPEEIKAIAGGGGEGLEVIEITDVPSTATSGILNESQMVIVNADSPSCIKFNNEYYYKMDDNHTEGLVVYSHTGYTETDGGSTIKYISITVATSAWTLTSQNVSGKLYMHIIKLYSTGHSIINDSNDGNLIANIYINIICSSPIPLNSWNEYNNLITKNTDSIIILPAQYKSQYTASQTSVINSCNIWTSKNSKGIYANVEYYTIGDTNLKSINSQELTILFSKSRIDIVPLG